MKLQNANLQRAFFFKERDMLVETERRIANQIYAVLSENDIIALQLRKPFEVLTYDTTGYKLDAIEAIVKDTTSVIPTIKVTLTSDPSYAQDITSVDMIADFVELFGEVLESIEYGVLD